MTVETIEKILEKLKEFRKEKGFFHENIAEELGISQSAYSNIEKNKTKLTVERLIKLSMVLDKPICCFLDNPAEVQSSIKANKTSPLQTVSVCVFLNGRCLLKDTEVKWSE